MKLIKSASGKTTVKMSKKEWTDIGKTAGWISKKTGGMFDEESPKYYDEAFEWKRDAAFDYFTQISKLQNFIGLSVTDTPRKLYDSAIEELSRIERPSYLEDPGSIRRIDIQEPKAKGIVDRLYNFGRDFINKNRELMQKIQRRENPQWSEDQESLKGIKERMKQRQETGKPAYAPGVTPPESPYATWKRYVD